MEISYRKRTAVRSVSLSGGFPPGLLCTFACFLTLRDQRNLCRKEAGQKHPTEVAERLANPKGRRGCAPRFEGESCVPEEPHNPAVLPKTRLGETRPPPPSLRHSQVSALAASAAAAAFALSPSFGVRLKKPLRSARPFTVRLRISSIAVPAEAASWRTAGGGSHSDQGGCHFLGTTPAKHLPDTTWRVKFPSLESERDGFEKETFMD